MLLSIYFFGLLPIPILVCIGITMYRRKQHLVYPIFWAYILFQSIRVSAEFICKAISPKAFFYSYWIASFTSVIFCLLLLRDIFRRVLEKYSSLDRLRRIGYDVALACVWLGALILTLQVVHPQHVLQRISAAELAASFTAVSMLLFVYVSSQILGIKWRSLVCGMATGLGLLGAVDLAVFAVLSQYVVRTRQALMIGGWIETAGFCCAVGIFAFYFLPQRVEVPLAGPPKTELLEWAESMKEAVRQ
ncbi:MAG TPA: hypothetical protein VFQ00_09820 [Terriglobales bacterium]|nr:hypothetical protein [Terriglobales bacterium]